MEERVILEAAAAPRRKKKKKGLKKKKLKPGDLLVHKKSGNIGEVLCDPDDQEALLKTAPHLVGVYRFYADGRGVCELWALLGCKKYKDKKKKKKKKK